MVLYGCEQCFHHEFKAMPDGTIMCSNCAEQYVYDWEVEEWVLLDSEPSEDETNINGIMFLNEDQNN